LEPELHEAPHSEATLAKRNHRIENELARSMKRHISAAAGLDHFYPAPAPNFGPISRIVPGSSPPEAERRRMLEREQRVLPSPARARADERLLHAAGFMKRNDSQ